MGDVSLTEPPPGNTATSQSMQPCTGIGSSTSVDLIFSRTRRTKMNTNEPKSKQGTDSSIDLPIQLHPQMKDVEPKLSTASDEQRLVAGTSTVDLQTRRLSGAQRKRLTRERKMREGTWMAEKPP
jgi:hypothetical protein